MTPMTTIAKMSKDKKKKMKKKINKKMRRWRKHHDGSCSAHHSWILTLVSTEEWWEGVGRVSPAQWWRGNDNGWWMMTNLIRAAPNLQYCLECTSKPVGNIRAPDYEKGDAPQHFVTLRYVWGRSLQPFFLDLKVVLSPCLSSRPGISKILLF